MVTKLISIGNSKGVRIPRALLDQSQISGEVELKVKKGEIKIVPAQKEQIRKNDSLMLTEKSLATDWNKPEEDKAWESLQ